MGDEVIKWCEKLTEAVVAAMNPGISHQARLQAYQLCEEFKEKASFSECMACGQQLASLQNSTVIRHFGLQLLENCVKFRWISATPSEKLSLKQFVIEYFEHGTRDLLEEELCIKDGLSRIMVEMIKREWPQHWPTLLPEFNSLCSIGETQTELVLLVLLRLVEDVVAFQNLQTNRRRDVLQALTSHMGDTFAFMLRLLEHHVERYKNLQLVRSVRVSQAVLMTLSGYVDWVSSQHIFANNNALLSILYALLAMPELKLAAAEVLQLIVNRKGKTEERCPILVLFRPDAIKTIVAAAENACSAGLDEENYVFLKRLCQVLTGLGTQLCVLLVSPVMKTALNRGNAAIRPMERLLLTEGSGMKDATHPESFPNYLEALLAFLGHPSMHLCSLIVPLLSALFRHELIGNDSSLRERVPQILHVLMIKLQKVGYPSKDDSPTCAYSLLDYDSDDEFMYSFSIHRSHQMELLRLITDSCPLVTFQVACDWFKQLLEPSGNAEQGKPPTSSHIHWDAFTCFLECVLGRLFLSDKLTEITTQLSELLQMALTFQTEDPAVLSCMLSAISTLFPVVKEIKGNAELVNAFLDKLFSAAVFSLPGQTKKTRTRPVQNVRRHACSALVKICRDNSKFMVHFFDNLYSRIKLLGKDQDQLTQMEKSTLNEVLILLSNEFKDLDKQSALIQEILQPVTAVWMSDTMKIALGSADKFCEHIGLWKTPTSPTQEAQEGANRATILACLATMMAVMKRSKWPADPQEAQRGGFCVSVSDVGIVYRDPCFQHILPLLTNVLALIRVMTVLWAQENRARIPAEYSKVFDIPENEKSAVLGVNVPTPDNYELPGNKSIPERLQSFLSTAQENCCHVLASACDNMGYELYVSHDFTGQLVESVSSFLHHAPDSRLRPVIRVFMKSLVQHCPVNCQDRVLLPALNCLCDFMLQRLSSVWNERLDMGEESGSRESNQESQEILDDMFLRLVTRDYLDLLGTIFRKKAEGVEICNEVDSTVEMMEPDTAQGGGEHKDNEQLSDLGKKILQQESLCRGMIMCIYSALSWSDTQTCIKSLGMCGPVFQQIVGRPLLPEAAKYLLTCFLRGLQVHGQHEACMAWLVQRTIQHYEVLRPMHNNVQEVMLQVPGVGTETLEAFDNRYIFNKDHKKPASEKNKRDNFKKLISGIIGTPVGQMFKREIVIQNLEPMRKPAKQRIPDVTEQGGDAGLVTLFAHDS